MMRAIKVVFIMLPLAFVAAYFFLPSERVLIVTGLSEAETRAFGAVGVSMQRVTKENAGRGSIQQADARIDALGPDQTLWLLPPRGGWGGLSMGDDLDAFGAHLGERFRFERRPNRWADPVFVMLLAAAAMIGALWRPAGRSTPPAR